MKIEKGIGWAQSPEGTWHAATPKDYVDHIQRLRDALKDALDYIDNPTIIPGPTLIVAAGRKLLKQ